jgi:hypothetical protein
MPTPLALAASKLNWRNLMIDNIEYKEATLHTPWAHTSIFFKYAFFMSSKSNLNSFNGNTRIFALKCKSTFALERTGRRGNVPVVP